VGNILNGLVLLVLGLILWIVASVVEAFLELGGGGWTWMMAVVALGWIIMIAGPVVFWAIIPIRDRIRRRREGD